MRTYVFPFPLAVLVLFISTTVDARTIFVPRCPQDTCALGADEYNTIDSALAAAIGGDRIHIKSGIYQAPPSGWKITVPLEIFGDGTGDPFIGPISSATWLQPAGTNNRVIVLDDSLVADHLAYIYIHDLTIGQDMDPPPAQPNSDGIYCRTTSSKALVSLRLARLRIVNMGHDGIHIEGINAGAGAIQGLSIEECVSHLNSGRGLYVENAQMFHLEGGIYSGNGSHGIYVASSGGAQLNAFECAANQRLYAEVGDDSQLFLEGTNGFRVTGGHFEGWASGANVRSAIGVVYCRGGYIGSCGFGNDVSGLTGARGVHIWYGQNTGIIIGPNSWSYVPTLVDIQDEATITSCVVEPQAIYDYDASSYTPKILVPEGEGRGHIIFAPVSGGSRIMAGIAFPQLSAVRRDSLTAAASGGSRREGLVIYNSTKHRLDHWDGTRWLEGIAGVVGSEQNFTNVTAPMGSTMILNAPPAGMYRVSIYALTRTAMNKVHTINLRWTDEGAARVFGVTLGTAVGSTVLQTPPIHISSGNLTFDTSIVSGTMSGSFALRIRVEALP